MTAGYGNHEPQRTEPGSTAKPNAGKPGEQQSATAKPGAAQGAGQGGDTDRNDVATPGAGTLPGGNQGDEADAASS
jgi:hypothetical protein